MRREKVHPVPVYDAMRRDFCLEGIETHIDLLIGHLVALLNEQDLHHHTHAICHELVNRPIDPPEPRCLPLIVHAERMPTLWGVEILSWTAATKRSDAVTCTIDENGEKGKATKY